MPNPDPTPTAADTMLNYVLGYLLPFFLSGAGGYSLLTCVLAIVAPRLGLGLALYGAACVAAFVIHTPVGGKLAERRHGIGIEQ